MLTPTGRVALHLEDFSRVDGKDQYFVADALGSISSIYNNRGQHVETRRYDPWGLQSRVITSNPTTGLNASSSRGYTGHEMLDDLGLVHMNGRIYDPLLGRFLSADIVVQNPGDLQAFNRYSYVNNRPLSLTDPSGFMPFPNLRTGTYAAEPETTRAVIQTLENPRVQGGLKVVGAFGEGVGATALAATPEPTMLTKAGAVALGGHALDLLQTGLRQIGSGQQTQTMASQAATQIATDLGASSQTAATIGQIPDAAAAALAMSTAFLQSGAAAPAAGGLQAAAPTTELQPAISAAAPTTEASTLFRGTTAGFPGNPGLQQIGITPTTTDPVVATLFATEAATTSGGAGVVQIATPQVLAGVERVAGNVFASTELEVGVAMTPAQFAQTATTTIPVAQARQILSSLSVDLPTQIAGKAALQTALESTPRLTPAQTQAFIQAATAPR